MVKSIIKLRHKVSLPCVVLDKDYKVYICRSWNSLFHYVTDNTKQIINCEDTPPETVLKDLQTKYNNRLLTPIKGYSIIIELAPNYKQPLDFLVYVSIRSKYKKNQVVGVFRNMQHANNFVDSFYRNYSGQVVALNTYTKEYLTQYKGVVI